MADWTDHLTKAEAAAILASPVKTRFPARNERGEKIIRYTALSASEVVKVKAKAAGA